MNPRAIISLVLLMLGCATVQQQACAQTLPVMLHPHTMVQIDGPIEDPKVVESWHEQILKAAAEHDFVTIEINTGGGRNDYGFYLAKTIEECGKPTICIVDGMAQSYGFYLLQSCSIRAMTKRSFLMAHESHYTNLQLPTPNRHELQSWADSLEASDGAMAEHYASRMGMPTEEVRKRIENKEWYLKYEDAQKYHAVDFVFESVKAGITSLEKMLKLAK